MHDQNCSHCQKKESDYADRTQRLWAKFPNLRNGDSRRRMSVLASPQLRLSCYEFGPNKTVKDNVLRDANALRAYLGQARPAEHGYPLRRLFIMEGVDNTYKAIFGAHLKIDPLFWLRHSKSATWETNSEGDGNVPPLASLTNSERSFHLWYCQLVRMNIDEQDVSICCADEERHIACSRVDGKFDGVGTIHRKTSFWAVPLADGGWEALLVVDRPFRRILAGTQSDWAVIEPKSRPTPFQGGYADFIAYSDIEDATLTTGPPRTSIYEDLRYYFANHFSCLHITASPRSAVVFVEKIVASEYMLLVQYHQNLLCNLQWRLSRHDHFGQFKIDWIEQTWSDLMAFQRRLDNRRISVQEIIRILSTSTIHTSLHHPPTLALSPSPSPTPSSSPPPSHQLSQPTSSPQIHNPWLNSISDFTSIETQLQNLLRKTDNLVAAFTALSGATAAQQSLTEARSVRSLSFLGMFFLPLSLVAGLFSMADRYLPGGPQFWVYFAVCVPFVLAVNGVAVVQTRAEWKWKRKWEWEWLWGGADRACRKKSKGENENQGGLSGGDGGGCDQVRNRVTSVPSLAESGSVVFRKSSTGCWVGEKKDELVGGTRRGLSVVAVEHAEYVVGRMA